MSKRRTRQKQRHMAWPSTDFTMIWKSWQRNKINLIRMRLLALFWWLQTVAAAIWQATKQVRHCFSSKVMETDIHHKTTRTQGDKRVRLQNTDNRHKPSIRAVPQYTILWKVIYSFWICLSQRIEKLERTSSLHLHSTIVLDRLSRTKYDIMRKAYDNGNQDTCKGTLERGGMAPPILSLWTKVSHTLW